MGRAPTKQWTEIEKKLKEANSQLNRIKAVQSMLDAPGPLYLSRGPQESDEPPSEGPWMPYLDPPLDACVYLKTPGLKTLFYDPWTEPVEELLRSHLACLVTKLENYLLEPVSHQEERPSDG